MDRFNETLFFASQVDIFIVPVCVCVPESVWEREREEKQKMIVFPFYSHFERALNADESVKDFLFLVKKKRKWKSSVCQFYSNARWSIICKWRKIHFSFSLEGNNFSGSMLRTVVLIPGKVYPGGTPYNSGVRN